MKKFLIIPILIGIYISIMKLIPVSPIPTIYSSQLSYNGEIIPMGETISVLVTRKYFGIIRLPIQINDLKLDKIHELFFYVFIPILLVILIILEIKQKRRGGVYELEEVVETYLFVDRNNLYPLGYIW